MISMTVNEFFRKCRDRFSYVFYCPSNPDLIHEKMRPQKVWFNKIEKIEMINKTMHIYISEETFKELYDPQKVDLKFYDLINVFNDKACVFVSVDYILKKKEYIEGVYIREENYLDIY